MSLRLANKTRRKQEMGSLTRADILGSNDLPTEKVECPEWGGYVYVKALTAAERDAWENSMFEIKQKHGQAPEMVPKRENTRARFCAVSMVDESGTLLFSAADVVALGSKSAKALDRVFGVAQRLSGLSNDDMDTLEKNLSTTQTDTSTTN